MHQLKALLWKDLRFAARNRKATVFEILFPIWMSALAGFFLLLSNLITSGADEFYGVRPLSSLNSSWIGIEPYSPTTLALNATLNQFDSLSASSPSVDVAHQVYPMMIQLLIGIYDKLSRYNSTDDLPTFAAVLHDTPLNWTVLSAPIPSATQEGTFLAIGRALALTLFGDFGTTNATANVVTSVGDQSVNLNIRAIFSSTGMLFLIYAFIPSVTLSAGRLVEEKRVRMRETLKVMGLSDWVYIGAATIAGIFRMAIGMALMSLILFAFTAIEASQIIVVFCVGLLFAVSLVCYMQLMPSLFSVSIWSNVFTIVFLSGSAALSSLSTGWPEAAATACCLLSPVAYYYGMMPALSQGSVTLVVSQPTALAMMAFDAVLYMLVALYVYNIRPGDFGVAKHPLFFLPCLFSSSKRAEAAKVEAPANTRIFVKKLVKNFGGDGPPAVNELDLTIFNGEIFALLGHNGAGKTTTMGMLTGMIEASSYAAATVNGHDIGTGMDKIREGLGFCPQFDVLYDDLSAREHLTLFAMLKGVAGAELDGRVSQMLDDLELPTDKQSTSSFSGGMKRRLSVGNALVGNPEVIFLDEPSSGMDPLSRRKMWDLLKRQKTSGRTLVLTTHFMEEADYLGDRIAIMSKGRMYACGSSYELKREHGVGFSLTAVKMVHNGVSQCDPRAVEGVLRAHVPQVEITNDASMDVTFRLPTDQLSHFGPMLEDFERQQQALGVSSYGVSMCTLEDVFVAISAKVERESHAEHDDRAVNVSLQLTSGATTESKFAAALNVPYWTRVKSQVWTVLSRKVVYLRRSRRMQLLGVGFPLFFMLFAFLAIQPSQGSLSFGTFSGQQEPDYSNLNVVFANLHSPDEGQLVVSAIQQNFQNSYPHGSLTVFVVDSLDTYSMGSYLPMKSLSFASGFHSPDVVAGVIVHASDLLTKTATPTCNYTVTWNANFNPAFAATWTALVELSVRQVVAAHSGRQMPPNVTFAAGRLPMQGGTIPPILLPPQPVTYNLIQTGIFLCLSTAQLAANCIVPVADELQRRVYTTTLAQGMVPLAYFVGNLAFDVLFSTIPMIFFIIGIYARHVDALMSGAIGVIFFAGIQYSVCLILLGYVLATYLPTLKPVTYSAVLHATNLLLLGLPYLIKTILQAAHFQYIDDINVFLLSSTPQAAFYHLIDIASGFAADQTSAAALFTFTGDNKTAWDIVFLFIHMIVPIALVYSFAAQRGPHPRWSAWRESRSYAGKLPPPASPTSARAGVVSTPPDDQSPLLNVHDSFSITEDSDVAEERQYVKREFATQRIAVLDVHMHYGLKRALRGVTFGIRRSECFGLLGPNGAGKTTTCKLLLREMAPTSGDIQLPYCGVTIRTPVAQVFAEARLGVCQQHDTLWEYLTAEEHLDQYLRLRLASLYDPDEWRTYIRETIEAVQLAEAGNKLSGQYSGGMKRKLQVACAMYTGGDTVFLDEPSTGMDPFARRALWKVIRAALSQDRCVVLTTHSMEEADAVCGRIGIMTHGTMRCLGSGQHLKDKFGSGYVITIGVGEDTSDTHREAIVKGIVAMFPGSRLLEDMQRVMRFTVDRLPSLAAAFRLLEKQKHVLAVDQYSVSQSASLEQVFLSFVNSTREGPEDDARKK